MKKSRFSEEKIIVTCRLSPDLIARQVFPALTGHVLKEISPEKTEQTLHEMARATRPLV